MTNVVKRLLYDEQKKWFNINNWSIFQDHLLSKGVTTYRYPSASNSGLDEKLSFLANENQINHFNANPSEIANNIMVSRNGPQWEKVGQDIDGEAQDDNSGFSLSLSDDGSVMAIGAPYNGSNSGHVRIYQYGKNEDGNYGWHKLGEDITGEASGNQSGNSVSLSADGSIVAIGAPSNNNDDNNEAGHVRVYEYRKYTDEDNDADGVSKFNFNTRTVDSSQTKPLIITEDFDKNPEVGNFYWTQLGLDIDGELADDLSGRSVSLSADGKVVAIGAINNDGVHDVDSNPAAHGWSFSGHVRIYEHVPNSPHEENQNSPNFGPVGWNRIGGDIDATGSYFDQMGYSVSLSADGSVVAIGAPFTHSVSLESPGYVRVYQKDSQTPLGWKKLGDDLIGINNNDETGSSVSLSADGTVIAIGSKNYEAGTKIGRVDVYKYNGSAWQHRGGGIVGEAQGDQSGFSVSLSADGSVVAIGAPFNDDNGNDSGHVRVYQYDGSSWEKIAGNINGEAQGDQSGYSVSLSADGSVLAIGAINNDGNGHNSGHVRVFQIPKRNPWIQQGLDIVDNDADDESGHSVSLNGDGSMLAIGSYAHNEFRGKVDVYVYENSKWNSDLSISSIDGLYYGFSVSLSKSGSVLAVSSQAWKGSTGKVDILEKLENGAWVQLGNSIEGDNLVDKSGWSVSCVDGRENNKPLLVAIGAIGNDGNGSESGHVRVYEYDINSSKEVDQNSPNYGPDGWKRVGQDIYGKAAGYESGYSVSLSAVGSTLAIGAPNPTLKPDLISHVRIFNLVEGEWEQQGGDIEEESAYNVSGWSVSLSGDGSRVAIGAIGNDGDSDSTDDYRGHVRVYQRDPDSPNVEDQSSPDYGPTGWKRVGQDIDGEDAGDLSGHSVSLSEDGKILAIGANISELIPSKAGYTRVYRCNVNNEWIRLGFNFEGELGDESSRSISLSGDGKMLAIGSRKSSGSILNSNENTGHVRVYKFTGWGLGT